MAKLVVEFDTVDKSFVVKQDGKKIDNVTSFSVYKSEYDEVSRCDVGMMEEDEENGMHTYTRMCASKNDEDVAGLAESKIVSGLFVKDSKPVVSDKISDFISNYLK